MLKVNDILKVNLFVENRLNLSRTLSAVLKIEFVNQKLIFLNFLFIYRVTGIKLMPQFPKLEMNKHSYLTTKDIFHILFGRLPISRDGLIEAPIYIQKQ